MNLEIFKAEKFLQTLLRLEQWQEKIALVMDLPASKPLRTVPYKSYSINS